MRYVRGEIKGIKETQEGTADKKGTEKEDSLCNRFAVPFQSHCDRFANVS
jgi:hypothetical protein